MFVLVENENVVLPYSSHNYKIDKRTHSSAKETKHKNKNEIKKKHDKCALLRHMHKSYIKIQFKLLCNNFTLVIVVIKYYLIVRYPCLYF